MPGSAIGRRQLARICPLSPPRVRLTPGDPREVIGGGWRTKIGRKAEAVIAALLAEPTHVAAATKAGVGAATVQRWLRDPAFQAAYRTARRAVLDHAVGRLQYATGRAVETLVR